IRDKLVTGVQTCALPILYYGDHQRLEHDFIVAAGADPSVISVAFDGVDGLEVDQGGELTLRVAGTPVRFRRPTLYQEVDGTRRRSEERRVGKECRCGWGA